MPGTSQFTHAYRHTKTCIQREKASKLPEYIIKASFTVLKFICSCILIMKLLFFVCLSSMIKHIIGTAISQQVLVNTNVQYQNLELSLTRSSDQLRPRTLGDRGLWLGPITIHLISFVVR